MNGNVQNKKDVIFANEHSRLGSSYQSLDFTSRFTAERTMVARLFFKAHQYLQRAVWKLSVPRVMHNYTHVNTVFLV